MAAKKTAAERLQSIVNETSGTTMTLSPKEGTKWSGYLLQQKKGFEGDTMDACCDAMSDHIEKNRVPTGETKRKNAKAFKYEKK